MSLPILAPPLTIGPLDARIPYTYVIPAEGYDSCNFDALPGWDISIAGNVVTMQLDPQQLPYTQFPSGGLDNDLGAQTWNFTVYASNGSGSISHTATITTRGFAGAGGQWIAPCATPGYTDYLLFNGYGALAVGDRIILVDNSPGDFIWFATITALADITPGGVPTRVYKISGGPADIATPFTYKITGVQTGRTCGNITSAITDIATRGTDYSYTITDDGFTGTRRIAGIPDGLGLSNQFASVAGRPVEFGWFPIVLINGVFQRYLLLTVNPGMYDSLITSAGVATALVGRQFSFQCLAPTITGTPVWTLDNAPSGIAINSITGQIAGIFAGAGVFDLDATVTNGTDKVTKTIVVTVSPDVPVISTAYAYTGYAGTQFTFTNSQAIRIPLAATGHPTAWTITGLPSGLNADAGSGLISGFLGTAGLYSFTAVATNATGDSAAQIFSILITATTNPVNLAPYVPWLHPDDSIVDLQVKTRLPRTVSSYYMTDANTLEFNLGDDVRFAVLLVDEVKDDPYLAGATSLSIGLRREDEFDDEFLVLFQNPTAQLTEGHAWYLFEGKLDSRVIREFFADADMATIGPDATSDQLAGMAQVKWIGPDGLERRSARVKIIFNQSVVNASGPAPQGISGNGYPPANLLLTLDAFGSLSFDGNGTNDGCTLDGNPTSSPAWDGNPT